MIRHLLGIIAAIALIIVCTLLPFFPGRYDPLAVPLSAMAQAIGILGLVLAPFGLLWLAADRSPRLAQWRHVFSAITLIVLLLVWAGVCLVLLVHSGFVLGLAALALFIYATYKVWPRIRRTGDTTTKSQSALPFYLIIVPVAVVLLQFALVAPAIEFSRNRAILNSAPLIAAIENYRTKNGRYPTSILAEWPDFWPGVIGVSEYRYEPHGDAYNLVFEQFAYHFGTREFVMYNPRDEHAMTAHAIDILELTPQQLALERTRGHYAVNNSPHPHWKYFWFD